MLIARAAVSGRSGSIFGASRAPRAEITSASCNISLIYSGSGRATRASLARIFGTVAILHGAGSLAVAGPVSCESGRALVGTA